MNLENSIVQALDLTQRLDAALDIGDMDICQDLLELRAMALHTFEKWHRQASEQERQQVIEEIRKLQKADQALQEKNRNLAREQANNLRGNAQQGSSLPVGVYEGRERATSMDWKA